MKATHSDLTLMFALGAAGIVVNLVAGAAALAWRKPGLTVFDVWWAGSSLAAHPDRYVQPDRARAVRVMFMAGVGLFLAAVVVLVAHI